jgi:hypothetical protein
MKTKKTLLLALLLGLLPSFLTWASYPIRTLDDVVPCFRATVGIMCSGHKAITNDLVRAKSIVKFEQCLQKHLQKQRSIAKAKGDTDRIEKIDRIVVQLKKEEELLKALKALREADKKTEQAPPDDL